MKTHLIWVSARAGATAKTASKGATATAIKRDLRNIIRETLFGDGFTNAMGQSNTTAIRRLSRPEVVSRICHQNITAV